ncbi:hypothetical protein TNCV_4796461 [Trichonephila clavipes]|uniref:Uncharacterized protein n=1 Tax=Trichonephila clavipes TaxID=2585209 RepID=A0A8X6V793_TRICX|nr:hypothetical protein TNCV_4796461 [Trichonephila clavipes]
MLFEELDIHKGIVLAVEEEVSRTEGLVSVGKVENIETVEGESALLNEDDAAEEHRLCDGSVRHFITNTLGRLWVL